MHREKRKPGAATPGLAKTDLDGINGINNTLFGFDGLGPIKIAHRFGLTVPTARAICEANGYGVAQ